MHHLCEHKCWRAATCACPLPSACQHTRPAAAATSCANQACTTRRNAAHHHTCVQSPLRGARTSATSPPHLLVLVLPVLFTHQLHERVVHAAARGQEEAGAGRQRVEEEQLLLHAHGAVVALLRLLDACARLWRARAGWEVRAARRQKLPAVLAHVRCARPASALKGCGTGVMHPRPAGAQRKHGG